MFELSQLSVDDALEDLDSLREKRVLPSHMKDQIQTLQFELEFLRMSLELVVDSYDCKVEITKGMPWLFLTADRALSTAEFKDWNSLVSELLERIEHVKPRIKKHLLDDSFESKFTDLSSLIYFTDDMLYILKDLVRLKSDKIGAVKMQIRVLEERLELFGDFADFTRTRCTSPRELGKFFSYSQVWVCKAVSQMILCWVDGVDEQFPFRLNGVVTDTLKMIKPWTPEVIGMYLRILKASNSSDSDNLLLGEIVANIVDFLLESVVLPVKDLKNLRDGMILLITFLMSPPKYCTKHKKLGQIQKQVNDILTEAVFVICSLSVPEINEESCKEYNVPHKFLKRIDTMIGAKIKKFYFRIADSSRLNFPRTNVIGFIDFLLENLGNLKERLTHDTKLVPFAKHQILSILEELELVRPFLEDTLRIDQEVLWTKIINVAYQADYVIDSCQIKGFSIWHTMISLSYLIKQIRFIKSQVQIIQETRSQRIGVPKEQSSQTLHAPIRISRFDEVVVGFEDEAKTIIDNLTRGSKRLKIVSIVGMPGIGKTTLAKKVYNDALIQSYFYKCAWCVVSQSYQRRELLLAILNDLAVDGVSNMKEDELAEKLFKILKWQERYLIVLDDVWDIRAWDELQESFPDDGQGSRILLTSRVQNIALQDHRFYYAHPLRLLTDEESLLLLQEKLKLKDGISSSMTKVARQIVDVCKGLPLSIVVVAGLLGRESSNLSWWNHVANRLVSKLASEEGCMDILQLSYKHLPNVLKPCFLYFGVFREDQEIEVQKLIQLWVAEGLIQKNGMRSLEDVAMGYLMDLIERSLVIAAKRNGLGDVRACRIHDLLHELCLRKARDENFLYSLHLDDSALDSMKYDQHRLCIRGEKRSSLTLNFTSSSSCRTLLIWPGISFFIPKDVTAFNFLRVLNFESFHFGWNFEPEIVSLTHLRYLGLCCRIEKVPSSIANLENLETFRISGSNSRIHFPTRIWMMKNLRHVDLGSGVAVIDLCGDELEEASILENLDSFSWLAFSFYHNQETEMMLRRLPGVTKLSIRSSNGDCSYKSCIQVPVMDFLTKLESLKLCFDWKVYHTCRFNFPQTLKELTLSNFGRPWSQISVIGKLPNLEVLKLLRDAFVGKEWDMEDEEFLKLKYLKLELLDIVEWNASFDSFPCLEVLVVGNCFFLKEIPSTFGDSSTLKIIKVSGYSKAASSARKFLDENEDLQVVNKYEGPWTKWLRDSSMFRRNTYQERHLLKSLRKLVLRFGYKSSKKKVCRNVRLQDIIIPCSTNDNLVKKIDFMKIERKRRMKQRCKYNCQSRHAIIPRYCHQSIK